MSMPTFLSVLLAVVIVVASSVWFFRRTRISTSDQDIIQKCRDLYQRIIALPKDVTWYADPSQLHSLPFPSIDCGAQINRFKFDEQGYFPYVGREKFPEIVDAIHKRIKLRPLKLNVYGTIGYGKSHILAALACYFTCLGRPVVYIPNCEDLVSRFVRTLKLAFLTACAHPSKRRYWPDILNIQSVEDAISFSQRTDEDFLFIVDQFDAIDVKKTGTSLDDRRAAAASALERLMNSRMVGHVIIKSVSANSCSYETVEKIRHQAKFPLLGGMSETEMASWWELWDAEKLLPPFKEAASRPQIEYMTGRIPLLLSPLFAFRDQTFEDIAQFYWNHEILRCPQHDIHRFARTYQTQPDYDDFIQTMGSFLAGEIQIGTPEVMIDRRYLYLDESRRAQIVCGIAREALASVIRQVSPHLLLGQAWSGALFQYRNNPSVLGFLIEQHCIAGIASHGLAITNKLQISVTSTISFLGDVVNLAETGLYVPTKPNCMAIDCVYATIDKKNRTAHIIPIKIAIAKTHSDSEAMFFQNWKRWTQSLTGLGYEIKATFVWIVEDGESVQHELQSGQRWGRPAYTSYHIPLSEVDGKLAEWLRVDAERGTCPGYSMTFFTTQAPTV